MKKGGKILDYCKVIAGQSPEGKAYNTDGIGMEFHQGKKAFGIRILEESGVWTTSVTKVAEVGDILMSVRAPVGPTNITDRKVCIGRGLAAIRCSEKILPSFVLYALKNIETAIIGNDGAVFNSINKKMIEEIPIPIADLAEQRRIVSYLDSSFDYIDKIKENASKSLSEAKTLFKSALAEAMEPKEGWEEKTLGELCSIIGGGTPSKKNSSYYNGDIPWATVSDMNCDYLQNTICKISDDGVKNSSTQIISKNEVIIATRVGLGKVCILCQDTAINQDLKGIVPKSDNKLIRKFIFWWFRSKSDYIVSNGVGATVKGVKLSFVSNLKISLPTIATQKQIVSRLDSLSSKVRAIEEKYQKMIAECDALKQAILREVFE